jgi:antitoxin (DNA-binding transcriptional repressor) of toxin-antitoxin stability system
MKTVTFTELRNNATAIFDAVEAGETLEVYRHGKPIAQIRPLRTGPHPRWIHRPKRIRLKGGASLSAAVIQERRESEH